MRHTVKTLNNLYEAVPSDKCGRYVMASHDGFVSVANNDMEIGKVALLHIALLRYINRLTWLVSCRFLTYPDVSGGLPHSRTKLKLGKRAFSVAEPNVWKELPTTLKSSGSLGSFRKNLKAYLFKIAFTNIL